MSEATTIPQQEASVDGGKAVDFEKQLAELRAQLEEKEAAYKGMQRNYNQLHQTAKEREVALEEMGSKLADLEQARESLTTERESVMTEAQKAAQQLSEMQAQLERERTLREMSEVIDKEFPALVGMKGILQPQADLEATRQMLSEVNKTVTASIQNGVRSQLGGDYPPGGSVSRGAPPSIEDLAEQALQSAGSPEFIKSSEPYYAMLGQSGKYPRPPEDRFGDVQ